MTWFMCLHLAMVVRLRQYEMDIWVLDINTGITSSYLDLDDSVSLFQGDSFGDKVDFFSLSAVEDADFDGDGDVDGNDFLAWQGGFGINDGSAGLDDGDANGDGNVNAADLAIWSGQFGSSGLAAAAVNAVPEPASVSLLGFAAVVSSLFIRRRNTKWSTPLTCHVPFRESYLVEFAPDTVPRKSAAAGGRFVV